MLTTKSGAELCVVVKQEAKTKEQRKEQKKKHNSQLPASVSVQLIKQK